MMNAAAVSSSSAHLLMCRPRFFGVDYCINPWMDPTAWASNSVTFAARAARQWSALHRALRISGACIDLIEPQPELPDLVFTANAAVVLDGKVLLARFRHPERQREQPVFAAAFQALQARGIIESIAEMPQQIPLEGAGDCIFDAYRGLFWMGCGPRSHPAACDVVSDVFDARCITLPLADPRFYHLDTALCALPCGAVIYYPAAFTAEGLTAIHSEVMPADRIELDRADAGRFAANAVCFDRTLVLSSASAKLRRRLKERGYKLIGTSLDAFQLSGGSACCLTLRLNHGSRNTNTSVVSDRPAAVALA